jgi:hypothetical protein
MSSSADWPKYQTKDLNKDEENISFSLDSEHQIDIYLMIFRLNFLWNYKTRKINKNY